MNIKKVYIKKFSEVSGFKVWIVNGDYIRTNIEREFTSYGQHHRFKFIPKNELWIDKMKNLGEEKFYVKYLLNENRLMAKGVKFEDAVDKANAIERRERIKEYILRNGLRKYQKIKKNAKLVHKTLLKKYSKKLKIWIIDGRTVRDLFFVDFTEGGHDKVYSFVPKGEVWIDNDLSLKEIKYVVLHELHERNLMAKGMDYDSAHEASSAIEHTCRKNKHLLDDYIKKELKKAEKLKEK